MTNARSRQGLRVSMKTGGSAQRNIPLSCALLVLASVFGTTPSATAQMMRDTYTGDGVAGRQITGLGFQPDVVLIKVDY